MRYPRLVPVVAATALLLTGCTQTDPGSPTDGPTVTVTDQVTDTVTAPGSDEPSSPEAMTSPPAASVPTGTLPTSHAPSTGAQLTVTEVRTGAHEGFDRVVFEFAGRGTPGWRIDYTDRPAEAGSGHPVELPGSGVISVALTGVGYPFDTGRTPFTGTVPGAGEITRVQVGGPFEGEVLAFVGTAAVRPAVTVSALTSPTRVVLDIAR
ncbi:hypothetical protein GOHSU_29_00360 [Gordonia hirsuta DSM 44140 = NBRC 16056]|uniref:AMIN-like domain-containing protein n=1 Tax=Gordonia hirsuta DSM 44140 = NBRC 16056 TaxID=1121927 RepID=L7LDE8_9ACTN|nr:hypothetical protein [Gordonia hirsuta]GAC58053.1 hypothetical protein GOHSU_29_00360 [Gordonia hirsuta DSM 44140 = NBRC 16056]